jgi:hypothetical protein
MPTWPSESEVDFFYGNPRGRNGQSSPTWERANIVRVFPPWTLVTAWDGSPVRSIRMHKKCTPSLNKIFAQIWQSAGEDQLQVNAWGMNLFSGGLNFRLKRGGSELSMHSWGCAIDFDDSRNKFGRLDPNFTQILPVRNAFASENWIWGGDFSKPDGMHWQAAKTT